MYCNCVKNLKRLTTITVFYKVSIAIFIKDLNHLPLHHHVRNSSNELQFLLGDGTGVNLEIFCVIQ